MQGIDTILDVFVILAALAQEPTPDSPKMVFTDAKNGCQYLVYGSPKGLEIRPSHIGCQVVVTLPGEEFGR